LTGQQRNVSVVAWMNLTIVKLLDRTLWPDLDIYALGRASPSK
jgi:hypothetical protein